MAVQILFNSVVLCKSAIKNTYPGGLKQFNEALTRKCCADFYLVSVPFMNSTDLNHFIDELVEKGFHAPRKERTTKDMAIVDFEGLLSACDWLELGWKPNGMLYVWLKGTPTGNLVGFSGIIKHENISTETCELDDISPTPPPLKYAPRGTVTKPLNLIEKLREMYNANMVTYSEVKNMIESHIIRLCHEDLIEFLQFLDAKGLNVTSSPLYDGEQISRRALREEVDRIVRDIAKNII